MESVLLSPGMFALLVFILCGAYVHHRGKVRHKFTRQLTDHSTIVAPVNCIMYAFSKVPNTPYIDTDHFPEVKLLRDNWEVIRDEALKLQQSGEVKRSDKFDDIGFNSLFKAGWKRFYLKWYKNGNLPSAEELCPKTTELLSQCPNVKAAMFTMLPPGGKLVRHRDPFAGSMRYHLGLSTPNSAECYMDVDGERKGWFDGQDFMFDETYIHYAHNQTDQDRLILFCDLERPMNNPIATWFNRLFGRIVVAAGAAKNQEGDRVGVLNRIFIPLYNIRLVGKRLKKYNRTLYYAVKYALFIALIYWIFF